MLIILMINYHQQTKLREGFVFRSVCDSIHSGGGRWVTCVPHTHPRQVPWAHTPPGMHDLLDMHPRACTSPRHTHPQACTPPTHIPWACMPPPPHRMHIPQPRTQHPPTPSTHPRMVNALAYWNDSC